MAHVFVSYVRDNTEIVNRLASELRAAGVTVWLDRDSLAPGDRWRDAVATAIANGDFFLACFSPEYAERDQTYMNEELTLAIDVMRQQPAIRSWFIPVLIKGGQIPDRRISAVERLSDFNAADLSGDWTGGIAKILKVLGHDNPLLARALSLAAIAGHFETPEGLLAIERLGTLGISDKRVLQVLIDATGSRTNERVKAAAVRSLVAIGPAVVPAVGATLASAELVSRKVLLTVLKDIGPEAAAAVPNVLALLKSSGTFVEGISGWFTTVEERAIQTLGAIGPAAKDAVPYLATVLRHPSRKVRATAALAMAQIGDASAPALAACFCDPEIRKDVTAGILWAGNGPATEAVFALAGAASTVAGLVDVLNGDHQAAKKITNAAIIELGKLGPGATTVRPVLVKLRKQCEDVYQCQCLDVALKRIPSRASPRRSTS